MRYTEIPRQYYDLAMYWNIRHPYGPYFAFGASMLLAIAIIWLGLQLSIGRFVKDNESATKALILISIVAGIFAAYGAAETIVSILANIIYLVVSIGAIFILFGVGRALWAGVPASGATVTEAKALEYKAKAKLEKAKGMYYDARLKNVLLLKGIPSDIQGILTDTHTLVTNMLKAFENDPSLRQKYSDIHKDLNNLKNNIENAIKTGNQELAKLALENAEKVIEKIEKNDKLLNRLLPILASIGGIPVSLAKKGIKGFLKLIKKVLNKIRKRK